MATAPSDGGALKRLYDLLKERKYINSSGVLAAEQLNADFAKKFSAGFEDCRLTELAQNPEAASRICRGVRRQDNAGIHPALAILMRWFLEESNGCTAPLLKPAREKPCYQPAQVTGGLRKTKRNEWLKVRAEHPEASRTVLWGRKWRLYAWLRTNDRRWFEAHLPKRVVRRGKRGQEGYSKSMLGLLAASAPSGSCERAGLPASRSDYQMRMGLGLQERTFANTKQNASGASWMCTHIDSRQVFVRERIEWAVTRLRERNELISVASIAHVSKLRPRTVRDFLEKEEPK